MTATIEGPARPAEIEGISNRVLIHPLSNRLVPILARMGAHPNTVSAAGFFAGLAGAAIIYNATGAIAAVVALLCLTAWLVLDGADGKLARATGQSSNAGRVIDGVADYSVFVVVYVALWLSVPPEQRWLYWWLGWAAGASHVLQSAALELARERYRDWMDGNPTPLATVDEANQGLAFPLSLFSGGYARLQLLLQGRQIALPNTSMGDPLESDHIAEIYRARFASLVRRWGFLSANSHAGAIILFVLAGHPGGYFLFEILVLNFLLVVFFRLRKRTLRALEADFAAVAGESDVRPVPNS